MSSTIMITGMAGSLARLMADKLLDEGHDVVGVDYRRPRRPLDHRIHFYKANYNKTRIEDVFRRHNPSHVLHLGRVGNLKTTENKRFDLNVVGSAKIMELCLKYGVKRLVVLSTFHIYGAHPHNHIPIFEDEPLRAGQIFPQIADAIQLDSQAAMWVYRHRKLRTVVLRPTNIVGPHLRNAISRYLRQSRLYYLWGFAPMWQFIHELDMVDALHRALWNEEVGVFNVAGRDELPITDALDLTGAKVSGVPAPVAEVLLGVGRKLSRTLPPYLLDFLKYPCVISDAKFREAFGYEAQVSAREAIISCVHEGAKSPPAA